METGQNTSSSVPYSPGTNDPVGNQHSTLEARSRNPPSSSAPLKQRSTVPVLGDPTIDLSGVELDRFDRAGHLNRYASARTDFLTSLASLEQALSRAYRHFPLDTGSPVSSARSIGDGLRQPHSSSSQTSYLETLRSSSTFPWLWDVPYKPRQHPLFGTEPKPTATSPANISLHSLYSEVVTPSSYISSTSILWPSAKVAQAADAPPRVDLFPTKWEGANLVERSETRVGLDYLLPEKKEHSRAANNKAVERESLSPEQAHLPTKAKAVVGQQRYKMDVVDLDDSFASEEDGESDNEVEDASNEQPRTTTSSAQMKNENIRAVSYIAVKRQRLSTEQADLPSKAKAVVGQQRYEMDLDDGFTSEDDGESCNEEEGTNNEQHGSMSEEDGESCDEEEDASYEQPRTTTSSAHMKKEDIRAVSNTAMERERLSTEQAHFPTKAKAVVGQQRYEMDLDDGFTSEEDGESCNEEEVASDEQHGSALEDDGESCNEEEDTSNEQHGSMSEEDGESCDEEEDASYEQPRTTTSSAHMKKEDIRAVSNTAVERKLLSTEQTHLPTKAKAVVGQQRYNMDVVDLDDGFTSEEDGESCNEEEGTFDKKTSTATSSAQTVGSALRPAEVGAPLSSEKQSSSRVALPDNVNTSASPQPTTPEPLKMASRAPKMARIDLVALKPKVGSQFQIDAIAKRTRSSVKEALQSRQDPAEVGEKILVYRLRPSPSNPRRVSGKDSKSSRAAKGTSSNRPKEVVMSTSRAPSAVHSARNVQSRLPEVKLATQVDVFSDTAVTGSLESRPPTSLVPLEDVALLRRTPIAHLLNPPIRKETKLQPEGGTTLEADVLFVCGNRAVRQDNPVSDSHHVIGQKRKPSNELLDTSSKKQRISPKLSGQSKAVDSIDPLASPLVLDESSSQSSRLVSRERPSLYLPPLHRVLDKSSVQFDPLASPRLRQSPLAPANTDVSASLSLHHKSTESSSTTPGPPVAAPSSNTSLLRLPPAPPAHLLRRSASNANTVQEWNWIDWFNETTQIMGYLSQHIQAQESSSST